MGTDIESIIGKQPLEVICETCGWDLADTTLYDRPICLKCLQGLRKGAA